MGVIDTEPTVAIGRTGASDHEHAGTRPGARFIARHARVVLILVLVAFVLRAIAAIALHEVSIAGGGDGFYFLDDHNYDRLAWQQAQAWHGLGSGVAPTDQYMLGSYVYTEAALYFVLGHQPLAMKLLNCLLGALTAGLVFLIAQRLFGYIAGVFAGLAAAFFPSTFLWSLMNLKDAMFVFAVALLLWLITLLIATGRWPLIIPILAAFALVGGVRTFAQAMLTPIVPGAVLLQSGARLPRKWALGAVLLGGCAALLLLSGGVRWFGLDPSEITRVRYCMAVAATSAFGTSGEEAAEECADRNAALVESPGATGATGATGAADAPEAEFVIGQSMRELVAWLPIGSVYALAAPFPWTADRAIELATIPEMLVWYAAVVLAVSAVVRHWRDWRQYVHLLGYIGGIFLLIALSQGNEGTLVRHRGMIIPILLVFSGEGAAWLWSRWRARRPVSSSPSVGTRMSHSTSPT